MSDEGVIRERRNPVFEGGWPATISAAAIDELAAKYRALLDLRRDHAAGAPIPARSVFRELAGRHPGVLAELDTLEAPEIEARVVSLAEASARGVAETWMIWIWGYHALFRAAIFVKTAARSARDRSRPTTNEVLVAGAEQRARMPVDAEFVRALSSPGRRRVRDLVVGEIARCAGSTPTAVRQILFTRRRTTNMGVDGVGAAETGPGLTSQDPNRGPVDAAASPSKTATAMGVGAAETGPGLTSQDPNRGPLDAAASPSKTATAMGVGAAETGPGLTSQDPNRGPVDAAASPSKTVRSS